MATTATSSGNTEAQALFTQYPVTLVTNGDYVELDYTFTETTNILQGYGGASTGPYCGLYDANQVAPLSGTLLWNGGFSTSATTADAGGTANWAGYYSEMWYGGPTGSSSWYIYTRPAQTQVNNSDQELAYGASGGTYHAAAYTTAGFPNLTVGAQYTVQFRITLSAADTLTVSNAMYAGVGISGAPIFTNIVNWTGANVLGTNFDGLCIGYRAGDSLGTHIPWTNFINSITVIAGLAAQAGPYYTVTSSGNPCSGGVTIGLSGSVTTNVYWLYANGVNSGQSVLGTGSAISFGETSVPANYTVVASNTVTGSEGPMYGSANVYAPGITVNQEPTSVTVVTNVTAAFSFGVTGSALSYQWYTNNVPIINGGNVSGAQSPNLVISLPQAANAASAAFGYYAIVHDPCGNYVTSSPPAALTLTPPRNLVWVGGNTDDNWEFSELNFSLSGAPTTFNTGDDVTFDDTSANTSVTLTNSVISTLVTVDSANGYNFSGTGKITGFGQLVDMGTGTLVIGNLNDYTGGTTVSNGATLQLGTGAGTSGSLAGIISIAPQGTVAYDYSGSGNATPINLNHGWSGSGTINVLDNNGSIIQTTTTVLSSNYNGTINIQGYTCLHAADQNAGYNLGNGSTINAPDGTQVWLDRSATAYNDSFNIGGNGWQGATPQTGAMRVYGNTINGPINLLDNARIGGTISGATLQGVIFRSLSARSLGHHQLVCPGHGADERPTSGLCLNPDYRRINSRRRTPTRSAAAH